MARFLNYISLPIDIFGRLLLGLYFLVPGLMKISGFSDMQIYMSMHGVPFVIPLLLMTIVLQIGAGLGVILGFHTKISALILAGLTLLICFYMHDFWNFYEGVSQQHELQNLIKNLGILAGLLILAARGAPKFSLDKNLND